MEAVLNSRPLQPLHSLPDDGLETLTPGHFLVGRPLTALPQRPIHLLGASLKRWNLCQRITDEFWQRWSKEYLQALQKAQKWIRLQRNFEKGDLVLIKDTERLNRDWPLARITQIHPGKDGLVRVVEVRTAHGTYTRPIHKLVLLLPISQEEDTSQESSTHETSEGTHPPDISSSPGENV